MKINVVPHPTRDGWYYVEYRPDGYKGRREREPIKGYEAACSRRDELYLNHTEPDRQVTTHPKLKDVATEYLQWVKKYKSASTHYNKLCRINKHIIPRLGNYRVKDLTQRILDEYGRNMASASYRDDLYHLLAMITWMTKRKYAEPISWKPEIPEYHSPIKTIPAPEDILVFLEKIRNPMHQTLFSLMLYTGLRWNEATHLRWEDYQGDSLRLTVTKTKTQERIYIPDQLQGWFEKNQKTEGWIFSWKGDQPFQNLQHVLRRAGKEAGIHMTPHLFRHASATFLYQVTNDLYAVKNHLRQSRITTTEIYTRYSVEQSKQSVTSLVVHMDKHKKAVTPL